MDSEIKPYIFSEANFKHPDCLKNAKNLKIIECPLVDVKSDSDLEGYGYLLHNSPDDISCEKGNFGLFKAGGSWIQAQVRDFVRIGVGALAFSMILE